MVSDNNTLEIMIVEDSESSLILLTDIVHLAGYRVRPALNSDIALKSIETSAPDLILLDVKMPGGNGYDLCSKLKTMDDVKDIPIIFVSALDDVGDRVKGFDVGGIDYITKPFYADEVLARIKTHLTIRELQIKLENKNIELKNNLERELRVQEQLYESEKLAALGRSVAGIAHELSTPIGLCITASSYLKDKSKQLARCDFNQPLEVAEFESYVHMANETLDIVMDNLTKSVEMLSNFKTVAVDTSSEKIRNFNLHDYLNKVISSLSPELRKTRHHISIVGDDLMLESYPGALSQVITNIIMNAVIHAYDARDEGKVLIRTVHDGPNVHLNCSDDGKGMSAESLTKIFEAYYTTRAGIGGSGLGTRIIYRLVTETLQGQISCSSELGKGTMFTITLPIQVVRELE